MRSCASWKSSSRSGRAESGTGKLAAPGAPRSASIRAALVSPRGLDSAGDVLFIVGATLHCPVARAFNRLLGGLREDSRDDGDALPPVTGLDQPRSLEMRDPIAHQRSEIPLLLDCDLGAEAGGREPGDGLLE